MHFARCDFGSVTSSAETLTRMCALFHCTSLLYCASSTFASEHVPCEMLSALLNIAFRNFLLVLAKSSLRQGLYAVEIGGRRRTLVILFVFTIKTVGKRFEFRQQVI